MVVRALARRLVVHPAVRFLALGGLVFLVHARFGQEDRAVVSVDQAPRQGLVDGFRQQHGRAPDGQERRALIEQWAQDEALIRHAYALRLHETDSVVRRRLIQDVEFLLEAEAEPVSERELRARYLADEARFVLPERRSFDHVFVAASDAGGAQRMAALARRLTSGQLALPAGDPSGLGPQIEGVTRERLAARLGEELAARAFELPQGDWSEPLRSVLGLHMLRLRDAQAPRRRPFEEVRDTLHGELSEEARQKALVAGRKRLREQYVRGAVP